MPPSRIFRSESVYPPSEDTALLLRAAVAEVRPDDRVLEIGCGSGTVAEYLLTRSAWVVATDINPHAVLSTRLRGVDVVRTDLAACLRGPFDLILFNPPYLPTSPEERLDDWLEYALDGGPDGRSVITRCIPRLPPLLSPEGRVLLLISSVSGLSEVIDLFSVSGFSAGVIASDQVPGEVLLVIRAVRSPHP